MTDAERSGSEGPALVGVAIAVAYGFLNLYLCYVAVHTLPGLDGIPRGYTEAGLFKRAIITASRSGVFVFSLTAATWLAAARVLWATHGALRALGLSALFIGLAWLSSVFLAIALWDS